MRLSCHKVEEKIPFRLALHPVRVGRVALCEGQAIPACATPYVRKEKSSTGLVWRREEHDTTCQALQRRWWRQYALPTALLSVAVHQAERFRCLRRVMPCFSRLASWSRRSRTRKARKPSRIGPCSSEAVIRCKRALSCSSLYGFRSRSRGTRLKFSLPVLLTNFCINRS